MSRIPHTVLKCHTRYRYSHVYCVPFFQLAVEGPVLCERRLCIQTAQRTSEHGKGARACRTREPVHEVEGHGVPLREEQSDSGLFRAQRRILLRGARHGEFCVRDPGHATGSGPVQVSQTWSQENLKKRQGVVK